MKDTKIKKYNNNFIKTVIIAGITVGLLHWNVSNVRGATSSSYIFSRTSVPIYEKIEIQFLVNTSSKIPFYEYTTTPPAGITPGIGVSVWGEFIHKETGQKYRHPAFYMTKVNRIGDGPTAYYEETTQKIWALRFAPLKEGEYDVYIEAQDAQGTSKTKAGSFTATPPTKPGYIQVSKNDSRYFEFTNGQLFWPIGPAWMERGNYDYALYKDTGIQYERPWLAGNGTYSGRWARWKSSAEKHGNEGHNFRLSWTEKAPGSELSYEFFYPEGHRQWVSGFLDNQFAGRIKTGQRYKVTLRVKTDEIRGPRVAGLPYGFTVKIDEEGPWGDPDAATFDAKFSRAPIIIPHISTNKDWHTIELYYSSPISTDNIYLYLDNVTSGKAYVDEFSMIPVNASNQPIGGELVRNPKADIHTYVEQRSAAHIDYQVEQAEKNGVYLQMVVHDKNDWVQEHLKSDGTWSAQGDGYYQNENTKARWLLRQWYRYLAARWGYSTAVAAWELNNEGPPNEDPVGSKTSPHWRTAEAFAKYIKSVDAHSHMASTSFWCCFRPDFWGNKKDFPSIDYADIHDYFNVSTNGNALTEFGAGTASHLDVADWRYKTAMMVKNANIGKPTVIGEVGIAENWGSHPSLSVPNTGVWYKNMLWVGLADAVVFDFNYWFPEHIERFDRAKITKPFYNFVKNLDYNKGGYGPLGTTTLTNSNLRVYGQKNLSKNKAVLWVQNKNHTWKNVLDRPNADYSLSGDLTLMMNPNMQYPVLFYNTETGQTIKTEIRASDATGKLTVSLNGLNKDVSIKIGDFSQESSPSTTPTATPSTVIGDANGDGKVNISDIVSVILGWGKTVTQFLDQNKDNVVNSLDAAIVMNKVKSIIPSPQPTATAQPSPTRNPTPTAQATAQATPSPTLLTIGGAGGQSEDWSQHAYNAQRTAWAPHNLDPWINISTGQTRWSRAWQTSQYPTRTRFNAYPAIGNGMVFIPTENNVLVALSLQTGQELWRVTPGGALTSTPVYDSQSQAVFVTGGTNVYRVSMSGQVTHRFNAQANIETSPLLVGNYIYATATNGRLFKLAKHNLSSASSDGGWVYTPSNPVTQVTMPSYSQTRDIIIYASDPDLKVRAINNASGTLKWEFQTPNRYGCIDGAGWQAEQCTEYRHGWPVVADNEGIVFTRLRLPYQATYDYGTIFADPDYQNPPGTKSPRNNVEIREVLTRRKDIQPLYALNLDTGREAFIPNVKSSGFFNGYLNHGPMPAIRTLPDGKQVAYVLISTSRVCGLAAGTPERPNSNIWCDHRDDTTIGEMVLNTSHNIVGCDSPTRTCQAGEIRYVNFYYSTRGDEHGFMSGSGDTVFHSNWYSVLEGAKITNRSNGLGATVANPIQSYNTPFVIDQDSRCGSGCSGNYCANGLIGEGRGNCNMGRLFPPGFYFYHTTNYIDTSGWNINPYVMVTKGYIIVRNIDGSVMAIRTPEVSTQSSVQNFSSIKQEQTEAKRDAKPETVTRTITAEYIYNNGAQIQIKPKSISAQTPQIIIPQSVWKKLPNGMNQKFGRNTLTWLKEKEIIEVKGKLVTYHQEPAIYIENDEQIKQLTQKLNQSEKTAIAASR